MCCISCKVHRERKNGCLRFFWFRDLAGAQCAVMLAGEQSGRDKGGCKLFLT